MCSCDCCDCDYCEEEDYEEDDEEVPSIPFGTLPAPPPFHRSIDELRVAMHSVFDQYPSARINMPAIVNIMMQRLNVKPHEFSQAEDHILGYIKGQVSAGVLSLTKGKNGGVFRNPPSKVESTLQSATNAPPINDHTCLGCGNTSCSKSERSCWKCGHPIG